MYTKFVESKNLIGLAGNEHGKELVSSIPLTKGQPYIHKLIFQEKVEDVKSGDILVCHADWECTSPYAYNVMVCTYISATPTTAYLTDQIEVTEANGRNIDLNIHHEQVGRVGTMFCEQDYLELYINFVAYAASTAAATGASLKVEKDYGRLVVHHYR